MQTPHEWLAALTSDSQNQAARRAGIPERTLYHQLGKGSLSVENVLKLAKAYDKHPLRALIDTGYVDPSWAKSEDVISALQQATPTQLADEMLRRIEKAEERAEKAPLPFTTPINELVEDKEPTGLRFSDGPELKGLPYVADSSPDEPEMGDEDYHDGP